MGAWKPPTYADITLVFDRQFQYMGAWKPPTLVSVVLLVPVKVSIHGGVEAPNNR